MKQIIFILLCLQIAHTKTLDLNEVLHLSESNNLLKEARKQETHMLEAKTLAESSLEPMELEASVAEANPVLEKSEYEYSIALSKAFYLGDTQDLEENMRRYDNRAYLLEEEIQGIHYQNELKSLYHNHCLDYKYYTVSKQNYKAFAELYEKKKKAYKYQEISKAELMQLEIEMKRLYAKLQEIDMRQSVSKQKLFVLGRINDMEQTSLSCHDIYPIEKILLSDGDSYKLSKEAHEQRIKSTQATLERYGRSLDSINLSLQYDKEIDMDRYGVGVSIPLNFSTNKYEQERTAAMYKRSALDLKHEQFMLEKKNHFLELRSYLNSQVEMLNTLRNNHRNYKQLLLPMIKKSYDLGEISVIEYLLNRQKSYELRQEIYATKKAYYNTLFRLYSLSETKDQK